MDKAFHAFALVWFVLWIAFTPGIVCGENAAPRSVLNERPRVLITTDGEIDDQCSMVRFLLYANEWDIEGIVTSSSQFHWRGHKWAGDDWIEPYLDAYEKVLPNLLKHDSAFPSAAYLRERHLLGNVEAEGEMEKVTPGSELIVEVLLDEADDRPVWLQAWGGTNTIARALKTIEEEHPDQVERVAKKALLFLIWEQDDTYQRYIRPSWEKHGTLAVISDQFFAVAYPWRDIILQPEREYFESAWMKQHILEGHGPLCSLYRAREDGSFRSEGDSPAFMHTINAGLRSTEDPSWGGWGGRYVWLRNNTWLDPVLEGFSYPDGRWYERSAQGPALLVSKDPARRALLPDYYYPMWRWSIAFQNDWAARADWSITDTYEGANHAPKVVVDGPLDRVVEAGDQVTLSAAGSSDPDGDKLFYKWWRYTEADTAETEIALSDADSPVVSFVVPDESGKTVHLIAEITDSGSPPLTRYQRVVLDIQ